MNTLALLPFLLAPLHPAHAVAPADEPPAALARAWRERLYFPGVAPREASFQFTVRDLSGHTVGAPKDRVAALRKRIAEGADDVDTRLELVHSLLEAREPEPAREELLALDAELRERLSKDREDWDALAELGEVGRVIGTRFRQQDALEGARELLHVAHREDPELARASAGLAELYLFVALEMRAAGDSERSAATLERALEHADDAAQQGDFRGHAVRLLGGLVGLVELSSGEDSTDTEVLERAAELSLAFEPALELSERPEVAAAIADTLVAAKLLAFFPHARDPREGLASAPEEVRARAASLVERIGELRVLPRLWSQAAIARWMLARVGELEDADECLEDALEAAEEPLDVLEVALLLEARLGEEDAAAAFGTRLEEEREGARTLRLLGSAAGELGDFDAARERFTAALELEPELVEARTGLAVALLKDDADRERARELLTGVVDEDDEGFTARFALGVARALDGDYAGAEPELEAALEIAREERHPAKADEARATLAEVRELAD